jgi:hypothetical protein
MASFTPLFMQLAIAQWYYVEIFCNELHSDRLRNVGEKKVELHECP